jgi:hypothetical protein
MSKRHFSLRAVRRRLLSFYMLTFHTGIKQEPDFILHIMRRTLVISCPTRENFADTMSACN